MRNRILLVMSFIVAFSFLLSACDSNTKTSDEKMLEFINESAAQAEKSAAQAREDYERLVNQLNEHDRLVEAINNAK